MSRPEVSLHGARPSRSAAVVCLATGLAGAAAGVWLAAVEPAVPPDRWSYPLTPWAFTVVQVCFAVQHLGLLAGLVGLLGACGGFGRASRIGSGLAIAGMVLLALTELAAIAAARDTTDTVLVGALGAAYGLACLLCGVGLVAVGLPIARRRLWPGWRRWVVLGLGLWVFVPMMPAIAASQDGARWSIAGWMLLFAALGVTLFGGAPTPTPPRVPAVNAAR